MLPNSAAIANHRQAVAAFEREHAAYVAVPGDHIPVCAALSAAAAAASALIATAPSTVQGLRAL